MHALFYDFKESLDKHGSIDLLVVDHSEARLDGHFTKVAGPAMTRAKALAPEHPSYRS
jgi:hypothetical protein